MRCEMQFRRRWRPNSPPWLVGSPSFKIKQSAALGYQSCGQISNNRTFTNYGILQQYLRFCNPQILLIPPQFANPVKIIQKPNPGLPAPQSSKRLLPSLCYQTSYSSIPFQQNACSPSNYKFSMPNFALLCLLVALSVTLVLSDGVCECLNGGKCSAYNYCVCPAGLLGERCQFFAHPLERESLNASLTANLTYFYFQPPQINYYKLTFNICMLYNPTRLPSILFIETERTNGSLRDVQPLFEAAKLVLADRGCAQFTTHYISVRRREDDTLRKIVVSMRALVKDDPSTYLNVYKSEGIAEESTPSAESAGSVAAQLVYQRVSVQFKVDKYIQNTTYGDFILISTASLLLIIFVGFINYLRKRYKVELQDAHGEPQGRRESLQLAERVQREQRRRQNQQQCVEIFMPVTKFGEESCFFVADTLSNCVERLQSEQEASCSICLNIFQKDEAVRTTPCKHQYHSECLDNWCSTNLSCPICRRPLDFQLEIRKIYSHFLRGTPTH